MKITNLLLVAALVALGGCCCSRCCGPSGPAANVRPKHVILIGFDGLAGNQVGRAKTPTMDRLMAEGTWTLDSRSILPSASACNWHSMFAAAASEQTGFNQWNSVKPAFPPIEVAENGRYPDVFHLLRRQRPDAEIGLIYEWGGIAHCLDTNACSFVKKGDTDVLTSTACDYIKTKRPTFLAVCFDNPDHIGHASGWGSTNYLNMVEELDTRLAKILEAVDAAQMGDETVVIVTSDHGGIEKSHGGATLAEMNRPLFIAGKGVAKGRHLAAPGAIYDVGATIAALLDVRPAKSWIGRPYDEAFSK